MRTCTLVGLLGALAGVGTLIALTRLWGSADAGGTDAASCMPAAVPATAPDEEGGLSEGLIALWSADGDFTDSVGGYHAEHDGSVVFAPGRIGQAFHFDGKGGHLAVHSGRTNLRQKFSLAFWFKPAGFATEWQPLVYKGGGDSVSRTFSLWLHNAGFLQLNVVDSAGMQYAETEKSEIHPGKWYHVACVVDRPGGLLRVYVNGRLSGIGVARDGLAVSTDAPLLFGASTEPLPTASSFCGLLDEVALWDRPLTDGEVQRVYRGEDPRGPFSAGRVTRLGLADRVVMRDGSVLIGDIAARAFSVTGAAGKFEFSRDQVAGLAAPPASQLGPARLFLADGQIVTGELADPVVEVKLLCGGTLKVPAGEIRELGLRIPAIPAAAEDAAARPTVTLAIGDRLFWTELNEPLRLKTDFATLDLSELAEPDGILNLQAVSAGPTGGPRHRVRLADGTTITGTLLPDELTFKLQLGPHVKVATKQVRQIAWQAQPIAPAGPASMTLRNGDRLLGDIADKHLAIETKWGAVDLAVADVQELTFDAAERGDVTARLWLEQNLRGRLAAGAVGFAISPHIPPLKIPTEQIASIVRPAVDPPAGVAARVEQLVAQLGAKDFSAREAAGVALSLMGPEIFPILRSHAADPDAEIAARVRRLLNEP